MNQLCILMGMPPQSLDETLAGRRGIPSAPPQVAVGIPAELLRRRPDVRRAEREVACPECADRRRHIRVVSSLLHQRHDLSRYPAIREPVHPRFHRGQRRSLVPLEHPAITDGWRTTSAFRSLAFNNWRCNIRDIVLRANAEAENAIVNFLKAQQQTRSLAEAADAARESVDLVMLQYREGKVDFGRVFINQEFLTAQQDQLAVAQGAVAQNLIQLYKALGGGWQIRFSNPAPQPPAAPEQPAEAVPAPAPAPLRDRQRRLQASSLDDTNRRPRRIARPSVIREPAS